MKKENLKKQTFLFIILALISLSFFLLDKLGWLNWLKRPVEIVTNPIKKTVYKSFQSISHQPSAISHQTDPVILGEKIKLLEQEQVLLKVENEELKKENEKMRHLLGASLPASWQFLPAKVLGQKEGVLFIDQGTETKVKEGMIVISAPEEENKAKFNGGFLVGRVTKVNPRSSQIMLIFHPQSQIAAEVFLTRAKGLVVGTLEGNLVLEQVLQKDNLSKGQLVVTTGENEQFPPNLLLGQVEGVEKIETEIYQKGFLEPLVDLQRLETVFIKL